MSSEDAQNLDDLRRGIDDTDREIVRLILRRAGLVREVGERKRDAGTPVYRPDREREVYRNVIRHAHEAFAEPPLPDEALMNVYREIMSGSIAIERGPAIAFMGPPSSFSHMACRQRFGSSIRELPLDTLVDVFRTVEAGRDAAYGVVPIDNTTEGAVGPTLDLFLTSDLKVYAEQYVRVRINLLHHEPIQPNRIRKLYSNRIALEQCRNWFAENLPLRDLEIVETASTAGAARLAAERRDGAAVASAMAAETYNLAVVAPNIQDNLRNITRFLIIGHDQCPPTGDDKTSILCSLHDEPGSLFKLLRPFDEAGINLTKIESRPSRRSYGDYVFFIDFVGHAQDPDTARLLERTEANTALLKVLGSYPRAEMPDVG